MTRPTQKQLLTTALLARGYVVDAAARSAKYATFRPTASARSLLKPAPDGDKHRVFLGKAGSCRFSSRGTVSDSIPFSERTVMRLLAEGRAGGIDAYEVERREKIPSA